MTQYLNKKQLAQCLNISVKTIERMVLEKRIPVTRVGGSVRFGEHEIEQWLKNKTTRVAGSPAFKSNN